MCSESPQRRGAASLAFCSVGICACYLYYGMLQEQYFSGENRIGANFALVSQTCTNSIVALIWGRIASMSNAEKTSSNTQTLNYPLLMLTSFCYIAAMSTSNYSFQYVSYPVAVLAKSCKLIPTMIISLVVERKRYSFPEWLAAACISGGIVLFNLSKQNSSFEQENSTHGIVLLIISLCMDGFLGSFQGLLKRPSHRHRPPSAMETMFFVNMYSLIVLVPMAIYSGEWADGMARWKDIQQGLVLLNVTAAAGQMFIFVTLTWFTPLVCTTITTTRKFFTILLSVLHFGHVLNWLQWSAVALVFGGLYVGIANKARGFQKAKPKSL